MRKTLPIINYVRVIAIWGVVFHHSNGFYFLHSFFSFGTIGVFICVAISGFLTGFIHGNQYQSYHIHDSIQMWKNKLLKFYLVHLLTFSMCIPLLIRNYLLYGTSPKEMIKDAVNAVINLLLLQSFIPKEFVYFGYNGVSWYLSMTLVLYFTAPFFIHHLHRRETPEAKLAFCTYVWSATNLLIWLLSYIVPCVSLTYIQPLAHIPGFLLAITAGILYAQDFSFSCIKWKVILPSLCMVLGTTCLRDLIMLANGTLAFDSAFIEALILAFILLLLNLPCQKNKVVDSLSKTSFELFMVHQMVLKYIRLFWDPETINHIIPLICMIIISLPLSYAIHYLVQSCQKKLLFSH